MTGRKRSYQTAGVKTANGGFAVTLDGGGARTPGGAPLVLPSESLARAVAREWNAQGETIDPSTMALTKLANTALDRLGPARGPVIEQILKYAATDLLCHRADAPASLAARQQESWQPLLDWAAETLGAELNVTSGVMPVAQPPDAVAALARVTGDLDDWELAALMTATAAAGSLILGLALVRGRLGAEDVFAASQLDESHQMETWGDDAEAAKARQRLRGDLRAAAGFLELVRSEA